MYRYYMNTENITSYTMETKFVYILMTDGSPRLAFDDESKAKEYAKNSIYENTTIVKVYNGIRKVRIEN